MDKKKLDILQAAMQLFVEYGLHAVTVAKIAQKANVGIGTIYKHFDTKEDIVQAIWIWQKEAESEFVFKDFDLNASEDVKKQFYFIWRRVIEYFVKNTTEYYFSYQFAESPVLTEEIHDIAMKDLYKLDEIFEKGAAQGLFKPLSPSFLRLYTFSTINGWILWTLDEEVEVTEDLIQLFLTMAWDAISIK